MNNNVRFDLHYDDLIVLIEWGEAFMNDPYADTWEADKELLKRLFTLAEEYEI